MSTTETPVLIHKYTCKDIPYSSVYSSETLQMTNDHDEGKVSYKKEHTDDAMYLWHHQVLYYGNMFMINREKWTYALVLFFSIISQMESNAPQKKNL